MLISEVGKLAYYFCGLNTALVVVGDPTPMVQAVESAQHSANAVVHVDPLNLIVTSVTSIILTIVPIAIKAYFEARKERKNNEL